MIGKITTGSNFRPLMFYLLKKEKNPRIIGGNVRSNTAHHLANEFFRQASKRATTKKPVKHYAIGFAPSDGKLDDTTKHRIAADIVKGMGFADKKTTDIRIKGTINNQYLVVHHDRHDPSHDEDHHHDHIHIAVNLINFDRERVNDFQDKRRLERVLRKLERKYRLKQITSSIDYARQRSDKTDASNIQNVQKPLQYLKKQLQKQMWDSPTSNLLAERLNRLGIEIKKTPPQKKRCTQGNGHKRPADFQSARESAPKRGQKYRFEYTVKENTTQNYTFFKTDFRDDPTLTTEDEGQKKSKPKSKIYTVDPKAQSLLGEVKSKIASAVEKNTRDKPSFSLFVERMKNDGINVILYRTAGKKRSGRFKVKYRCDGGIELRAGSQLGGGLASLIREEKIVFNPEDWRHSTSNPALSKAHITRECAMSEKASLDSPEKVEDRSFLSQQNQSTKRARRRQKKSQLER